MFDPSAAIISLIERFMTVTVLKSNEPRPIPTIPEFIYKTAICFIGAWLAQFILGGLFNSANHPLVDFPGPKRAEFTEWYRTYLELFCGRSWVHVLEEWHQKYGTLDCLIDRKRADWVKGKLSALAQMRCVEDISIPDTCDHVPVKYRSILTLC